MAASRAATNGLAICATVVDTGSCTAHMPAKNSTHLNRWVLSAFLTQ